MIERRSLDLRRERMLAVRFAMVGAATAGLYFVLLVALIEIGRVGPGIAAAVAYVLAIIFNYQVQRKWTFESQVRHVRTGSRYLAMSAFLFATNALIMHLAHLTAAVHYLVVQLVAAGIMVVVSFLIQRYWIYRK